MADYPNIKLALLIIRQCLRKCQYLFQNTLFESGPVIPYFVHRKASLERIKDTHGIVAFFYLKQVLLKMKLISIIQK